jgi:hypothetical protein
VKAGKVWALTASAPVKIEIAKDTENKLDASDVAFKLEGDMAITNRTLALHYDKQGKPGRVVACGVVTKIDIVDPSRTTTGMPAPMPQPGSPTGGGK